ncbi:MGMT family protein [Candidatus Woesearchaeota archaeon]|nr:MGMT family protein [Candidatus Woesearchaeota archaeon]
MDFKDRVYSLTKKIPKGRITTYKEIGKALKKKGQVYRAVGRALKENPYAPKVPCHRVVKSDGSLGGYRGKLNSGKKIQLLKKEGITVKNNKIMDFKKKLFRF